MSTHPITKNRLFEFVTPQEWEAKRPRRKWEEHADVGQAIAYLLHEEPGTAVKIKCFNEKLIRTKYFSARHRAARRGIKLACFVEGGWLYMKKEKD